MYIKRYKVEEEFVFVNRYDDDLIPIKLKVPDIPNDNLIHNFGLPNSKQKYFRSQMPARLTQLAKRVWKDILGSKDKIFNDEMNREIFRHRDKYQDIHLWIEKE